MMLAQIRWRLGGGVSVLFSFYFLLFFNQWSNLHLSFAQQSEVLHASVMLDLQIQANDIESPLFSFAPLLWIHSCCHLRTGTFTGLNGGSSCCEHFIISLYRIEVKGKDCSRSLLSVYIQSFVLTKMEIFPGGENEINLHFMWIFKKKQT